MIQQRESMFPPPHTPPRGGGHAAKMTPEAKIEGKQHGKCKTKNGERSVWRMQFKGAGAIENSA